jgi:hypothetical protein
MEWVCREIIKEVANCGGGKQQRQWMEREPASTRTSKEEEFLHRMQDQLDKEDDEKRIKKGKRIAKTRGKMGVGREQNSLLSIVATNT